MKKFRFMPLTAIGLTFLYVGFKLWRAYPCNNGGNIEFLTPVFGVLFVMSLALVFARCWALAYVSTSLALLGYSIVPLASRYSVFLDHDQWIERGRPDMFTRCGGPWVRRENIDISMEADGLVRIGPWHLDLYAGKYPTWMTDLSKTACNTLCRLLDRERLRESRMTIDITSFHRFAEINALVSELGYQDCRKLFARLPNGRHVRITAGLCCCNGPILQFDGDDLVYLSHDLDSTGEDVDFESIPADAFHNGESDVRIFPLTSSDEVAQLLTALESKGITYVNLLCLNTWIRDAKAAPSLRIGKEIVK